MTPKALTRRWTPQTVEDLLSVLRGGRQHQPFGLTDDKYGDLRGVPMPDEVELNRLNLLKSDLSGARLRYSWLEACAFENVRFNYTDMSGIADHGNTFRGCRFEKTNFREGCLGYRGSKYHRCLFVGANFTKTAFIRVEFDDCEFIDCKLKGVDFNASSFVRCSFIGVLEEVWFRGGYALPSDVREFGTARRNEMLNVSFEMAELRDVTFSNGCDLTSVKLPESGDYRLYSSWRARLEALRASSMGWSPDDMTNAEIFFNSYMVHAEQQDSYVLNCDDLRRELGTDFAQRLIGCLDSIA